MTTPDNAKLVAGWWLPASEEHFARALSAPCEEWKRPLIDGRAALGYHRIKAALDLLPPERRRTAVDVGAHVGWWSAWLVGEFQEVHAFEPVLLHLPLLRRNAPGCVVSAYALGAPDENTAFIAVHPESTGRSHIECGSPREDAALIPMKALDDFELVGVDLVKIDVEGYERRVLLGGEETIRRDKSVIVIEQIGNEARYGEPRDSALRLLRDWGAHELRPPIKGDHYMGWA